MAAPLIRDRYEPIVKLAEGAQGEVVQAVDRHHDRSVVLKVRPIRSAAEHKQALGEAGVLLQLSPHRGLPVVREDFLEGDRYYLVMDWVEGVSLAEVLELRGSPGLPFDEVLGWLADVAAALDHLHAHEPPIVHRDVKPANVMLTPSGDAVLVDLGIAAVAGAADAARGTAGYLAPELVAGRTAPATAAADLYSLAATAFVLLTGAPPEPGARPDWRAVPESIRDRVVETLGRGLSVDPESRPASASALVESLKPPAAPTNLPAPVTTFVGRERETAEIRRMLQEWRLVTIVGAGGSGKSRLSLQVAAGLVHAYPDGVWFSEFSGVTDGRLVVNQVASALGVGEQPSCGLVDVVEESLAERRALLVLDNCEHVLDQTALLVERLLSSCPELRVIATSREPLSVGAESISRLGPMSVPEEDVPAWAAEQFEAVRLFLDRARAVSPDLTLDERSAGPIARICRRLDGLPLAIEMAAARLWSTGLDELATGLEERFLVLEGTRTALPRHRTIAAALDWSHDLLDGREQTVFRRLAVFAGGFRGVAAGAVAGGSEFEPSQVAAILDHLARVSLISVDHQALKPRFRLLEPVREYAAEKLAAAGEGEAVAERHGRWCCDLSDRAGHQLRSPAQAEACQEVDAELDNIRLAVERYLERGRWSEVLGITGPLESYFQLLGHWSEFRRWLEAALAAAGDTQSPLVARALVHFGVVAFRQGDTGAGQSSAERGLLMARDLDHPYLTSYALQTLATFAGMQGRFDEARTQLEEIVQLARSSGDLHRLEGSLANLGIVLKRQGDYERAEAVYRETLAICAEIGEITGGGIALSNLANLLYERGQVEEARSLYEEAAVVSRRSGDRILQSRSFESLAVLARADGDLRTARLLHEQSLELRRAMGDSEGTVWSLTELAQLALLEGDLQGATEYAAEAGASLHRVGINIRIRSNCVHSMVAAASGNLERAAELVHSALDDAARMGDPVYLSLALSYVARLEEDGRPERCATLVGATLATRGRFGLVEDPDGYLRDGGLGDRVRNSLGPTQWAAAWEAGRAMASEEAIEYANGVLCGYLQPGGADIRTE